VFDTGTGYAEGDSLRITLKSQKITVSANDYEITDATGRMFYGAIRQTMRGTNSAALAAVCTEGRLAELDGANLPADVDAILEDTGTTLDGIVDDILEDTAEIGAAAGASISADIAAVKAETASILEDTGTTLDGIVDDILEDTAVIAAVKAETASILEDTGELGAAVGASISADIAAVKTEVDDAVLQTHAVSGMLPTKTYLAGSNDADGGLDATETAVVNAQVVDALATDTYAEPGQGNPAATASLAAKLGYLYKSWRNKKTNDGATNKLYNDAGDTVDQKAAVSEAAGTLTKAEYATGP